MRAGDSPIRLTVLGSSGGCPGPGNPASGYLIRHSDTTIWCDAGSGTFMSLMDHVDPDDVDAIVISHVHTDHCADLVAFYGYMAYGPSGTIPVPVYVPPNTVEPIASFVRAEGEHVFFMTMEFNEVGAGDEVTIGSISVRFAETNHPVPTVASRYEIDGRSLAYSGDTGPGGGYPALLRGCTTALCEATIQGPRDDQTYPYHLTAGEAGAVAARAGVERLILTHLSPTLTPQASIDEAATTFGSVPDLATPGTTFEI
jgi:ribonuclease BN (tRNA processing enzyme)